MRAIEAEPRALATFRTLNRQNIFSLAYRTHHLKTPEGARQAHQRIRGATEARRGAVSQLGFDARQRRRNSAPTKKKVAKKATNKDSAPTKSREDGDEGREEGARRSSKVLKVSKD